MTSQSLQSTLVSQTAVLSFLCFFYTLPHWPALCLSLYQMTVQGNVGILNKARFLRVKRRRFVLFLNLSGCHGPAISAYCNCPAQVQWRSLSFTHPAARHAQVMCHKQVDIATPVLYHLLFDCRHSVVIIPSVKFQAMVTNSVSYSTGEYPLPKTCLFLLARLKTDINSTKRFFLHFLCQESGSHLGGWKISSYGHLSLTLKCVWFLPHWAVFL